MKLLDTTFLIHYWAGNQDAKDYLEQHSESEFVTTTLNIKEIAVGRELQGKLNRQEILTTFEWLTLIPLQADHAFVAAELEAELHRENSVNQDKINALAGDILIAGVAKDMGATVVTENTTDFERFDTISVDGY
jgi:predicted nucleic acid-binding protein